MKTAFSAYSQTIRASKLETATMGRKLNGRLFRVNGKPFRVNGELFRVHGKLFHIDLSSCEDCFLAIIGMFGWVLRRFQEANLQSSLKITWYDSIKERQLVSFIPTYFFIMTKSEKCLRIKTLHASHPTLHFITLHFSLFSVGHPSAVQTIGR